MKLFKETIFLLAVLVSICSCDSASLLTFEQLYELEEQDDFFSARDMYEAKADDLSKAQKLYTEAVLNNAFNRLEESNQNINSLLAQKKKIADSLQLKAYELKFDNDLKLYKYKDAKEALETIRDDYSRFLDSTELADFENSLKIWTALESTPPQEVNVQEKTIIKMVKDFAGLSTLRVSSDNDSLDFIFDTGANLSTTSLSVAQQLNMTIIPVDIEVGTITGEKVLSQLAVCEKLMMGNIEMKNVVFLVLPDESLSFPQYNYQIFGILGYPLIEALKEVHITQDGEFIVPLEESSFSGSSNMAMDGLTPLICIDKRHYTFDTGADQTILYHLFYMEDQEGFDEQYETEKISFAGAAGVAEFDGYVIPYSFNIAGQEVMLDSVDLLKEKIKDEETVHGNIGQDIIKQFDTMILNFDRMYISFE